MGYNGYSRVKTRWPIHAHTGGIVRAVAGITGDCLGNP